MKNIAVLGSTGSIGTQTLDVVRANPDMFCVKVLAANSSVEALLKQIEEFKPELAVLADEEKASELKRMYSGKTKISGGGQGLTEAARHDDTQIVVTSLMGFAGLAPTLAALDCGKDIALANKETLVVAGELVMKKAAQKDAKILPVDSEHCALFQCLQGEDKAAVEKLILTASGGPFRGKTKADLESVTLADCLNHPTWSMGKKITVDSATLVNKGLEVIEAHWLYDIDYDDIDVVVHPQSIIHSMVAFRDGAVMAQLGSTDMKLPIQYALTYPTRVKSPWQRLDFWNMKSLTFEKPDTETFKGLAIAYEAGRAGGMMPCIMNAANEVAVASFLAGEIRFSDIYTVIEAATEKFANTQNPSFELLCEEDKKVRSFAADFIRKRG